MTQSTDRPSAGAGPYRVGFLLIDNFTLIALATAIEPLRMANQLTGQELYSWQLLTADGSSARASDGITLAADSAIAPRQSFDLVLVVAGVNVAASFSRQELFWLKAQARQQTLLGAVCTGAYVLASAGLLDGYACSAHWECLTALRSRFPQVRTNSRIYSLDRRRMTCTGGSVPMHMMLSFLAQRHGPALAQSISEMFICDRVRDEQEQQPVSLRRQLALAQPKLAEVTQLMEANIEEPIGLQELATLAGISRRQLERLFLKHLECTPSRYYMKLRLQRARRLLTQTATPIVEIAALCGFVSAAHFSRCYRKYIGVAPRYQRARVNLRCTADEPDHAATDGTLPRSLVALHKARFEPTYGVFRAGPVAPGNDGWDDQAI